MLMFKVYLKRFREVLKSREIFSNWLMASILYLLGKDRIRVKCLSGETYLPRDVYGRVVRGYFIGFIYQFDCNGNEFLINGQKIRINRLSNYFDLSIATVKNLLSILIDKALNMIIMIVLFFLGI